MRIKIAPSILAADFSRLAQEIELVEDGGADLLHFDVMDGRFVPNLSFGPQLVKSIRNKTKLTLAVHLMVEEPSRFISPFVQAEVDAITIHVECFHQLYVTIEKIRSHGKTVGLALNPSTPLSAVEYLLENIDTLLLMTVDPGFGGQRFIQEMLPKIRNARQLIDEKRLEIELAVDGGINMDTAPLVVREGATVLVAGSAIFGSTDPKKAIEQLKRQVQ